MQWGVKRSPFCYLLLLGKNKKLTANGYSLKCFTLWECEVGGCGEGFFILFYFMGCLICLSL